MPFSDDLKDNISVTPYIAFVALLVGGNLFVADLNRKEREAELARITDIVGERNIVSGSIAEQFAFQFAKIVMPTITADNLHARHHGLNVVYAKPDVRSQTHVPVVIQSPTSLVSGSYFQINNGLSTETHHCASAHRINLSGNPYNNDFHIASLYTQCAEVSLARTSAGTANDYTSQIPIALRDTIAKTLSGQASQPEKKLEIFVGSKSVQLMPDISPLTPEQIRPYALIGKTTYDCDLIYKAAQVRVEGYGLYKSWNDSNPRPVIAVYACTKAQHG